MDKFEIVSIEIDYSPEDMSTTVSVRFIDLAFSLPKTVQVQLSSSELMGIVDDKTLWNIMAYRAAEKVGHTEFFYQMSDFIMAKMFGMKSGKPNWNKFADYDDYTSYSKNSIASIKKSGYQIKKPTVPGAKVVPKKIFDDISDDTKIDMSDTTGINSLPGIHEKAKHPVDGNSYDIMDIIISLNDDHKWSREAVADWLETLDVDLRFKPRDDMLVEQRRKKIKALSDSIDSAKQQINLLTKKIRQVEGEMLKAQIDMTKLLEEENEQS